MYLESFTEANNFDEHLISSVFDWNCAMTLNYSDSDWFPCSHTQHWFHERPPGPWAPNTPLAAPFTDFRCHWWCLSFRRAAAPLVLKIRPLKVWAPKSKPTGPYFQYFWFFLLTSFTSILSVSPSFAPQLLVNASVKVKTTVVWHGLKLFNTAFK